jgi:hypothetical protein
MRSHSRPGTPDQMAMPHTPPCVRPCTKRADGLHNQDSGTSAVSATAASSGFHLRADYTKHECVSKLRYPGEIHDSVQHLAWSSAHAADG